MRLTVEITKHVETALHKQVSRPSNMIEPLPAKHRIQQTDKTNKNSHQEESDEKEYIYIYEKTNRNF